MKPTVGRLFATCPFLTNFQSQFLKSQQNILHVKNNAAARATYIMVYSLIHTILLQKNKYCVKFGFLTQQQQKCSIVEFMNLEDLSMCFLTGNVIASFFFVGQEQQSFLKLFSESNGYG